MDEDEKVTMSVADIHLLREVARWRRANGVGFFQWRRGVGFGAFTEWKRFEDDGNGRRRQVNVSYEPGSDCRISRLVAVRDYHSGQFGEMPVSTVTEAVDVLVALGYLPARFSSAYAHGHDAAVNALTVASDESTLPVAEVS